MVHLLRTVTPAASSAEPPIGKPQGSVEPGRWAAIEAGVSRDLAPLLVNLDAMRKPFELAVGEIVALERCFFTNEVRRAKNVLSGNEHVRDGTGLIAGVLSDIAKSFPACERGNGTLVMEIPAIGLLSDAKGLVQTLVKTVVGRHFDGGRLVFGAGLASVVVPRLARASGLTLQQACEKSHKLKRPAQSDLDAGALVETYLGGTPLAALLLSPVKMTISDKVRMSHMHVIGNTGSGKTQTLQHIISKDLDRPSGQECGMLIMDSQGGVEVEGSLLNRIARLKQFADNDRLIIIDPTADIEHPPALSMFDFSAGGALSGLSALERETAINSSTALCEFVIGGLVGAEMTQLQEGTLRHLAYLMISLPGSTLATLSAVLEEPKDFSAQFAALPDEYERDFFSKKFSSKGYGPQRKQIGSRIDAVRANRSFSRMLGAKRNKLDLFTSLNQGKIVLVNTAQALLQKQSSAFGRYIIALAAKATFDRVRIAEDKRRPSFIIIDEASSYLDDTIGEMLIRMRKFRCGLIVAHQELGQLSGGLKDTFLNNCAIKLASGVHLEKDARVLAPSMHTTADFLMAQRKGADHGRFATYVADMTTAAVSWKIPFGSIEKLPRMTDAQFASMLERNRRNVCS